MDNDVCKDEGSGHDWHSELLPLRRNLSTPQAVTFRRGWIQVLDGHRQRDTAPEAESKPIGCIQVAETHCGTTERAIDWNVCRLPCYRRTKAEPIDYRSEEKEREQTNGNDDGYGHRGASHGLILGQRANSPIDENAYSFAAF